MIHVAAHPKNTVPIDIPIRNFKNAVFPSPSGLSFIIKEILSGTSIEACSHVDSQHNY